MEAPLPLFVILFIGFGMKAGLFPMHIWLPEAHPAAPSHVSAIMSGVMIKTGIYGVVRLMQAIDANTELLYTIGLIVLLSGIVTGLWGVIFAAMQNDVKRLLAYSSIENIGVILIGLGIAAVGHAAGSDLIGMCGMCGALLHTVNHSLFKTMLFFGAGNIYSKMHTTTMNRMGGIAKHMPLTAALMAFAVAAICALPPLNGFVSELFIYIGMFNGISDGHEVLYSVAGIIALSLIGGIVVLAFTKLYGVVFLGSPRSHEVAETQEVDGCRIGAMAIPAAFILFIGLFPQYAILPIARVAEAVTASDNTMVIDHMMPTLQTMSLISWILIAVIVALFLLKRRAQRSRTITEGPTWGCGFTALNTKMQYTGEQLGGQKYAMSDMVTTLHLAADVEGEFWGRNANFSGAGVAENTFEVTSMSQEAFDEWVQEVHETAEPLTEEKFAELLEPGHLGRSTYTGTHLEFSPAPSHAHGTVAGEVPGENQTEEHSSH